MHTLTLQATFCGLLHDLGKLAFRSDKTTADLLAALPDTPDWAAVRSCSTAEPLSDAARCAAFARSLSVTADTPADEPASSTGSTRGIPSRLPARTVSCTTPCRMRRTSPPPFTGSSIRS